MIPLLVALSVFTNPPPIPEEQNSNHICFQMESELQNSVNFEDIDEATMNLILLRCYVNYS